jgi:hypothetical protein
LLACSDRAWIRHGCGREHGGRDDDDRHRKPGTPGHRRRDAGHADGGKRDPERQREDQMTRAEPVACRADRSGDPEQRRRHKDCERREGDDRRVAPPQR